MNDNYDTIVSFETDDFGNKKIITRRYYDSGLVETFVGWEDDDEIIDVEVVEDDEEEIFEAELLLGSLFSFALHYIL